MDNALELRSVYKSFNNVEVLNNIDFTLRAGEVKGLIGKNGAGKSTLVKIVQGVYEPTAGTIRIFGKEIPPHASVKEHLENIGMIYQEFSLVPDLTVTQNIFLNQEILNHGLIDDKESHAKVVELFERYEIDINPRATVSILNTSDMQMVEICKQLMHNKRILLMDEPTAALEAKQSEKLYQIIHKLKAEGISIVFISHHLAEILENCDSVHVLLDGKTTLNEQIENVDLDDMINAMLGEEKGPVITRHRKGTISRKTPVLELRDVTSAVLRHPVSLKLYPKEVLGLAGLKGSGRTEIMHILFGIDRITGGEMLLDGRKVDFRHPEDAMDKGIFLVPENRQTQGLVLEHDLYENMTLPWLGDLIGRSGLVNDTEGESLVDKMISRLAIKCNTMRDKAKNLSGGNQQKVVIGKALGADTKILLMDDPTYGVDVHAKVQIMDIVDQFKRQGGSVIFVSSELEEVAENCDRILVLHRREIVRELCNDGGLVTKDQLAAAIQ
ncbi:MAG TPA: sugar ABC transporter ATP-binding protein [Firmicutes bacterium]|nr:sugar ABC transporter ATP-binding protein [Bacillota bacterium]